MTTENESIKLTPTWTTAASIYIAALENGGHEGKAAAREGIMEMAQHLDRINVERREQREGPP